MADQDGFRGITLYHRRPDRMIGDRLVPLADLDDVDPEAAARAWAQYTDRPGLLERVVEPLGCRWAQCVFLAVVDPRMLLAAAREARPSLPSTQWLTVTADALDPTFAVLFTPRQWELGARPAAVTANQCREFTPANLRRASQPAEGTLRRLRDPDNRLPLWTDVDHVLHRGPLRVDPRRLILA